MKTTPIQESFAGGELSDRLRGHVSSELYKRGVAYLENVIAYPQGPLFWRGGTDYEQTLDYTLKTRFLHFRASDVQEYLIQLLGNSMKLFHLSGTALVPETVYRMALTVNGDFKRNYGAGWETYVGSFAKWEDATCLFDVSESNKYLWRRMYTLIDATPTETVLINGGGSGTELRAIRQQIVVDGPAYELAITFKILSYVGSENIVLDISSTAPDPGDVGDIYHYSGHPVAGVLLTFPVLNVPAGTYWFMVSSPAGSAADIEVGDAYVDGIFTTELTELTTPWTEDEIADVQVFDEPGADRLTFFHPNHPTYFLKYHVDSEWDFRPVAFAAKPEDWAGNNWPGLGDFIGGRLVVSGFTDARNRVLGSRTTDIYDFSLYTSVYSGGSWSRVVLDSDGFDMRVATPGAIVWLKGFRNYLIGTDLGEFSITSSGPVIAASDMQAKPESGFGGAKIQALTVGSYALFVTADRRQIRMLSYDLQKNGWDSKAITFAAEHITEGLIKEVHHIRTPESILVVVLETGKAVCCTLDPEEGVVAWWRLTVGDQIVTAVPVQTPSGSYLLMAVKRGSAINLEKLAFSEDNINGYLDCSITVALTLGQVEVSGLDHLEGRVVSVVLDGAVEPDATVSGGKLTLDRSGTSVNIGLKYTNKVITLPPAESMFGKVRSVKVGLLLNDSALPVVNGKRIEGDRSNAVPLDTAPGMTTGKARMVLLGWAENGVLTIEQDVPLRTEVLGIYGTGAVNSV